MDFPPPIKRLPADAVANIRSSLCIRTLNEVVLELVKNSLDANAQKVTVVVDFAKGGCTVEDDGCGIRQQDFEEGGGIAVRYSMLLVNPSRLVFWFSSHTELTLTYYYNRHFKVP